MEKSNYFSLEELQKMLESHNKTVTKILCHLWQNIVDESNSLEIVDSIQLQFSDKTTLTIGCNSESSALEIIDFDYEQIKNELKDQFGDKIKMHVLNASKTKMWEDVEGKVLLSIRPTKEGEYYKSDSLMLDFGEEQRVISISHSDGLIIDYYEED